MKKNLKYCFTAALIFSMLFSISSIAASTTILKNGNLKYCTDGKVPDGWTFWKYAKDNEGSITYHKAKSKKQLASFTLTSEDNDVRLEQVIPVEANTAYRFSAEVDAGSFDNADGVCAILSIPMQLVSSPSLQDTSGWVSTEVYIQTASDTKEIKLSAGIGGHSALNTGSASFRNLQLVKVNAVPNGANVITVNPPQSSSSNQDSSNPGSNMFIYILMGIGAVILVALLYYILAVKKPSEKVDSSKEIEESLDISEGDHEYSDKEVEEVEDDDDDLI